MLHQPIQSGETFRPDPRRPGYCRAWRLNYRREKNGKLHRIQDGERFYAAKADAEFDAAYARRNDDADMARLFGPLIVEVREINTAVDCLKWGAIHGAKVAA